MPVITNGKQLAQLTVAQPPPEYPPVAKVNYLEGLVRIEITVDQKGRVAFTHVVNGNPLLADAALKAVSHWIYHPLETPTGPMGFNATVKVRFSLRRQGTELTPRQAELDFQRRVKPPQIVPPSKDAKRAEVVHMRLLVDDRGQVVDRDAVPMNRAEFEAACENLRAWSFHPAYWGTMPIASYLDVDVPVDAASVARAGSNPEARSMPQ
jgi:TonB family protein